MSGDQDSVTREIEGGEVLAASDHFELSDVTARQVAAHVSAAGTEGDNVLVVTHSPQVAALGAHHWRVEKSVTKGMTTSRVVPLSPDERVDEIARMVAGDTITEAARGGHVN